MSLTYSRLVGLLEALHPESMAMLRILQRSNPVELPELYTLAEFDVKNERRILKELTELGLVERYVSRFGVELVGLTLDAKELLDEIDAHIGGL